MINTEAEKELAAAAAVREVADGMTVGLGTGSTAAYAVRHLAGRVEEGLRVTAAATSRATEALARTLNIPVVSFSRLSRVDLTIDGADEVDAQMRAIKGAGGALVREKIVATASDRVIIVVDSSKPVEQLGRAALPIEFLPFAEYFVRERLTQFQVPISLRMSADVPFRTDQGNHIFDMAFGCVEHPEAIARMRHVIPGIVGHGLFLSEIDCVMIGRAGSVETQHRYR